MATSNKRATADVVIPKEANAPPSAVAPSLANGIESWGGAPQLAGASKSGDSENAQYLDEKQVEELTTQMTPGERARALRAHWNNYSADRPTNGGGDIAGTPAEEASKADEKGDKQSAPKEVQQQEAAQVGETSMSLWESMTMRSPLGGSSSLSDSDKARARSARRLQKTMSSRSSKATGKWDETPYRARPPALRGLRAHHDWLPQDAPFQPPWAYDESVYNVKFQMWSAYDGHFGTLEDRSEFHPERVHMREQRKQADMCRWFDKFCA